MKARPKRRDRLLGHEALVRQSRYNSLDNEESGQPKDIEPPGVGYYDVVLVWQSFSLGNLEKELHEAREQWCAKVVDILSSVKTVPVFRTEPDVAELLRMGNAELNQAA